MTDKNYSLLRPFDEEAAKRGEAICKREGCIPREYIAGPDRYGALAVIERGRNGYSIWVGSVGGYCMAPLCWVEGKPVYKGDVLELEMESGVALRWVADGVDRGFLLGSTVGPHSIPLEDVESGVPWLHWPRPKPVKRWVNVYADKYGDMLHETKDAADASASYNRVTCIEIELSTLEK